MGSLIFSAYGILNLCMREAHSDAKFDEPNIINSKTYLDNLIQDKNQITLSLSLIHISEPTRPY